MKKLSTLFLAALMMVTLVACGSSEQKEEMTAEIALNSLKDKVTTVTEVIIFDENTDPNDKLGRPGEYTSKGDFFDSRIELENDNAGTIEFFSSKADCNDRYDYLCQFAKPSMGALGTNQYIYKYDLAVFRVNYELTPEQASEYKTAMDEIICQESIQFES